RVMVSAFGLIPRISPLPIESSADVLDAAYSFFGHAGKNHLRTDEILNARPRLLVIRKWNSWAFATSVVAHENRGFIVQSVNALHRVVMHQVRAVIVFVDGSKRGTYVRYIE